MYERLPPTLQMYSSDFNEPGLQDKLDGLEEDGSNVIDIFYRNYRDWVIWENRTVLRNQLIRDIVNAIDMRIQKGYPAYGPINKALSKLLIFAKAEINYFSESDKTALTTQQIEKSKHYVNHIKKNLWRYDKLDKVALYLNPNRKQKQIADLAKGKIDLGFIDIKALEKDTHNVLNKADRMYFENELSELHPAPQDNYSNIEETIMRYFKFDYYKNPIEYEEFPNEKITYLKTLKTWITILLNKRKEYMNLEILPPPHQLIEIYASSLVQSVNQASIEQSPAIEINKMEVVDVEVIEYPRYIFKDYKSYQFFNHLASHFVSKAQISFLYRMMNEQEKPQMIVVKDTPFREWFNETDHPVKMQYTTDTFEKSKSADRIAMYNIAKELFFNK